MQYNGMQSILTLLIQLAMIVVTFRAIQSFHLDTFFRHPPQGLPAMIVLLSIAIGYASGSFFAEFFIVLHGLLTMAH